MLCFIRHARAANCYCCATYTNNEFLRVRISVFGNIFIR